MRQRGIPGEAPKEAWTAAVEARRVLVVDDEPDIREILAEILQQVGYRVDMARSGREALERLVADSGAEPGYDIVLSDIRMPEMSGMELYRRLSELRPDLAGRFIIVTGDDLSGAVRVFLDETRVPFIEKPFTPAEVRRLVAATAGRGED